MGHGEEVHESAADDHNDGATYDDHRTTRDYHDYIRRTYNHDPATGHYYDPDQLDHYYHQHTYVDYDGAANVNQLHYHDPYGFDDHDPATHAPGYGAADATASLGRRGPYVARQLEPLAYTHSVEQRRAAIDELRHVASFIDTPTDRRIRIAVGIAIETLEDTL